ncbi:MAG: aspartate aminotransferase family protein [Acidimicrobiia bacterium]
MYLLSGGLSVPRAPAQVNEDNLSSSVSFRRKSQVLTSDSSLQSATATLLKRAVAVTPHGSQTLSKSYRMQAAGSPEIPLFIERAEGAWVVDVEGRKFLDYPMALGSVILGHNHPRVVEAIETQLSKGVLFSLPSPIEIEAAEAVLAAVPSAHLVKFVKTGSEACSAAVRIARAFTGRDMVAVGGFHGWHDFYAATTTRSLGVPASVGELSVSFRFNEIHSLESVFERHGPRIAAVLLEPASAEPPDEGFLETVAQMTSANGSLLVFDEVITGFRWERGGAQERYNVYPDLTVLGKAMGNGMPIAAVCGRQDVMAVSEEIFVSGTYGGECLSLAAVKAVLGVIESEPVIDYIWDLGRLLRAGLEEAIHVTGVGDWVRLSGEPPWNVLSFPSTKTKHGSDDEPTGTVSVRKLAEDPVLKSIFQQEMAKRAVLFNGSFFVSYAHTTPDIELTVTAAKESFAVVADAASSGDPTRYLVGDPMGSVF